MYKIDDQVRRQGEHRLLIDLAVTARNRSGDAQASGDLDQIGEKAAWRRDIEVPECARSAIYYQKYTASRQAAGTMAHGIEPRSNASLEFAGLSVVSRRPSNYFDSAERILER